MSDPTVIDDAKDSRPEDCLLCDRGLAVVGLVIAGLFLYISLDVIFNGGVTNAVRRVVSGG